ncbi:DinB family protein [Ancylobacter oerskovii]|uniref:DinB family protein n=1 Tax=Ancylobacter oerskovii TaxID=459519 RepID=A0ABW4Z3M4_9HYPH|nr:DinB family protein [Ancylobacter oerskovii]MBS7545938.1 damage-inducible protein DinB [Ancylobacter oerskovii]
MVAHRYSSLAHYNAWANHRVYEAAARLSPAQYMQDRGAFFGSVHGTLNHMLVADRIWMRRFTGNGEAAWSLDTILFQEFDALRPARTAEDARIIDFVAALDDAALTSTISYRNSSGAAFTQPLDAALDHFFNHQTHHRGQVHALLSAFLGNADTPSLDLIRFQRENAVDAPFRASMT